MTRRGWRLPILLALAGAALFQQAAPANAVFHRGAARRAQLRSNTQLVMSGTGPGQGLTGFIAGASSTFDPTVDPYPSGTAGAPPAGFTTLNQSFAGIIHARPPGETTQLSLYCIDILTSTRTGIGYVLGTWDAANVPNVGFVARVLDEYYPNTNQPAALTNLNQKAAAVQAAIWFFSDRYVLSTTDPLRNYVVAIVAHVRSEGPVVEPPPPTIRITPGHISGHAGSAIGPFTVTTDHPPARVSVTGGRMYSNPEGTSEIGDGVTADVPSGQRIWLRSTGPPVAVLNATSRATVPSGNVYLYDGNTPGTADAQKLILARTATLTTTVQAEAEFLAPGALKVKKTITGSAAGSQGRIVINVSCDDGVARRPFIIPANTAAGTRSRTYRDIPAGTKCTVIETSNGSTVGTDVVVTGDGANVTIPHGATASVHITDTYDFVPVVPGSLLVTKTIAGPLAGHQGSVTVHVVCDGTALSPDFVIPAGTGAGTYSHTFDGLASGSRCTVTETADGATDTVTATVSGNGQTVTISASTAVAVNLTDVYERTPGLEPEVPTGVLRVTKTIGGPDAGRQGRIAILVSCGGPLYTYSFIIPAHRPAGSVSRDFPGLPAGSHCTVTETENGHGAGVTALASGGHKRAYIGPDTTATVHLTDAFIASSAVPVTG